MRLSDLFDLIEKEGNQLEWVYTTKHGIEYKCLITRNDSLKNLCGYVIMDEDDDFYGFNYNNIPVSAHGGLTYSDEYEGGWMIGFDCAHSGDLVPGFSELSERFKAGFSANGGVITGRVYRDMNFVKSECERIADQISEISLSKRRKVKLGKLI